MNTRWDVIVLGAGPGGLAAGGRLASTGLRTLILEASPEAGGLCRGDELEGTWYERVYHGIVPQDRTLLNMARSLGLAAPPFRRLPLGSLVDGRWRRANRLQAAFASLTQGRGAALALLRTRAPSSWDRMSALTWIREALGGYGDRYLAPLLMKKFGAWAPELSLMALYGRLSRENSGLSLLGGSQRLAAFPGGLRDLVEALQRHCGRAGAEIRLSTPATGLFPEASRWGLETGHGASRLDSTKLLSTLPLPVTLDLLPRRLSSDAPGRRVRHLDAGVVRILATRSASPFYFAALPGPETPFVALVEGTRLRPHPKGLSVLYLSRYAPEGTVESPDILVKEALRFLGSLPRPLTGEAIVRAEAWTAAKVQPLFDLGYLGKIPRHRSPWPGLFFSDASQIYPGDRGVSATLSQAERVADLIAAGPGAGHEPLEA